jgi:hypothetical protein
MGMANRRRRLTSPILKRLIFLAGTLEWRVVDVEEGAERRPG